MLLKIVLRFLYVKEKIFELRLFLFVCLGLWEFQEKEVIMSYLLGFLTRFRL